MEIIKKNQKKSNYANQENQFKTKDCLKTREQLLAQPFIP
jgi:hypothetical protein